jgi:hypothetical protein
MVDGDLMIVDPTESPSPYVRAGVIRSGSTPVETFRGDAGPHPGWRDRHRDRHQAGPGPRCAGVADLQRGDPDNSRDDQRGHQGTSGVDDLGARPVLIMRHARMYR